MNKRNKHFEKKYKKVADHNEFFVYTYIPVIKSSLDLLLNREISLLKLKKINLPSAFKLEKAYEAQGPKVKLVYGSNLNFSKLKFFENYKVLGLKIDNLMYSHQMLKDTLLYNDAFSLCFSWSSKLINQITTLYFLLKEKEVFINKN